MQNFKNIIVGFLVSFIGSIPLGYLNVIGLDIYSIHGLNKTISYLFGVVFIEFFVVYFTLIFANKLAENKKMNKYIEGFSILFMLILAIVFFLNNGSDTLNRTIFYNVSNNFFVSGILYSCLNFIQIPFWTGWNIYLINSNHIKVSNSKKIYYLFGTITGTFLGMLMLIFSLNHLIAEVNFFKLFLFKYIIPAVFLVLGIFQALKFYKKYHN